MMGSGNLEIQAVVSTKEVVAPIPSHANSSNKEDGFTEAKPNVFITYFKKFTPTVVLRIFSSIQILVLIGLIGHYYSSGLHGITSFDSIIFQYIQLITSLIMLAALAIPSLKRKNFAKKAAIFYAVVSSLIGLALTILFVMAFNEKELNCRVPSIGFRQDSVELCDDLMVSASRNSIFWVIQLFCIHTAVTYIMETWVVAFGSVLNSSEGVIKLGI